MKWREGGEWALSIGEVAERLEMSRAHIQLSRHFTYLTAHSQTLPLLHLRHNTFSNPSFAFPTSQALRLRHLVSRPWNQQSHTSNAQWLIRCDQGGNRRGRMRNYVLIAYVYCWSVESQRHQTKRFPPWSRSNSEPFSVCSDKWTVQLCLKSAN